MNYSLTTNIEPVSYFDATFQYEGNVTVQNLYVVG